MDKKFAADVVRDGSGPEVGPFERCQNCFNSKQIIPLCAGWFREVNRGVIVVLKELAQLAAAGEMGLSISIHLTPG